MVSKKNRIYFFFVLLNAVAILIPSFSIARPVAYKDAISLGASIQEKRLDFEGNYSITRWFSFGPHVVQIDEGRSKSTYVFPQFNFLLKRWNLERSQANVYLFGGPGYRDRLDKGSFSGFVGGQADFETRRVYMATMGQSILSTSKPYHYRWQVRVGVAPYLASYKSLQTWIIAKVDYQSYFKNEWTAGPGLRFMWRQFLLEAGSGFRGEWFVNFLTEF